MAVTSFMCELSVECLGLARQAAKFAAAAILQLSCHAEEYVEMPELRQRSARPESPDAPLWRNRPAAALAVVQPWQPIG
jgi:hypothetical protein